MARARRSNEAAAGPDLADDSIETWTTATERAHIRELALAGDYDELCALGADPALLTSEVDKTVWRACAALARARRRAAIEAWCEATRTPWPAAVERFGLGRIDPHQISQTRPEVD